ncbi:GTP-binding protein [Paenibacillus sp. YPG26]|uniref:CobW family GTP-binding protein n=1 Tax=Paenibacillus sp. YPG26 TaxID=2878915 RepID=UPI00203D3FFC|nr:GTP-binding protein [Paenibacillus sp. YPG26]USB32001.1 GTP-binding protein [Paenibacillus sp. YPG26]
MTQIPVYILSGFLGSGKTTLLQQLITYWKDQGLRPAVVMNEIGDVNLDGLLVEEQVPMAEMLSGCICCSIRADLSSEMSELIAREKPDVVIIEATGAANPMEVLDAVAEVSLYQKLEIMPMITVVDAPHLLELSRTQKGKTFRLMQDQIRCGSVLILNKVDRVDDEAMDELGKQLVSWNTFAKIIPAVRCQINLSELLELKGGPAGPQLIQDQVNGHSHAIEPNVRSEHIQSHSHESHNHVTVYTHYFQSPVNSELFEQFIKELPRDVYRGKGVLTFSDTSSRFLFQYAYRESDYMRINPQGDIPDVAVFIGEHFDKQLLASRLTQLEDSAVDTR